MFLSKCRNFAPKILSTMKKALLFLLLFFPLSLFPQIVDDFADGDFTHNPAWTGSVDKFVVNGNEQLQLNDDGAGTACLALPIVESESMEWRFWLHQAFAPSGNNYTDVWLCADVADLSQAAQGYFLRFGESGSDDAIELFRKDANGLLSICRGNDGAIASAFAIFVRVSCDQQGHWTLQTCYDDSGIMVIEAKGEDAALGKTGWFGLCATYTVSNAQKVYFDDVYVGPYHADHEPPSLLSYKTVDPSHLRLCFNEALLEVTALSPVHYSVNQGMGFPMSVSFGENRAVIVLEYEREFVGNVEYKLTLSRLKDQWGNTMQFDLIVSFYLPDEVAEGDILINEILFDPIDPGVDYVELYNQANKTIDLSTLQLGVVKEGFPDPPDTTLKEIAPDYCLLMPRSYVLLSTDSEMVGQQYDCPTDNYVQMASFPNYTNAGGTVLLMTNDGLLVDAMAYSKAMHYPLLKETKGVSLERVSFSQPSMEPDNWHSAAENAHFGTPGQPNSMMQYQQPTHDSIALTPDVFSPDGDGIDDVCFIHYRFDEPGYTINIYVFNAAGQLVRHLAKGELVGQEGSVTWNGIDDNGSRVAVGVYVIVTEVFSLEGKVKQFKNAAVVATR